MRLPRWLLLSAATALLWGVWGAYSEYPAKQISPPFPSTLIFVVNALAIIPVALLSLKKINWRPALNKQAMAYGLAAGLTGGGGQLLLFLALRDGPAYLIFPIIALSPAITVGLSFWLLREKAGWLAKFGIFLALVAIVLMSMQPATGQAVNGYLWLLLSLLVFLFWGVQAYIIKASAKAMDEDSMFVYLAVTLQLFILPATALTDFNQPINWGFQGPYLSFFIQLLNTAGVLLFVYAIKSGKAVVVVPIINGLYPVITIVLSLLVYRQWPYWPNAVGMIAAVAAIVMISYEEGRNQTPDPRPET